MSVRIRYVKTEENNIFESLRIFVSSINGARYKVFLDLNDFTFKIRNENTKTFTVKGGEDINNLNVLKRAAKRHLAKLGVEFNDENRQRTFGICDKGYTQKAHTNKLPSE